MVGSDLKPRLVHIFVFVMIWRILVENSEADDIPRNTVGEKQREKTVYDVTEIIRSTDGPNQTINLPVDLYHLENDTLANYYLVANDRAEYDYCWEKGDGSWKCWGLGIKGISIIFGNKAKKRDILGMRDLPINGTTIVNLLQIDNSSIESITILLTDDRDCKTIGGFHEKLVEYLTSNPLQSVRIGLEYDNDFLEVCAGKWFSPVETFDHTILRIHVSPLTTLVSYRNFFNKLHGLVQKNREWVRKVNPQCILYVRLQNADVNYWKTKMGREAFDKYNALMTSYLHTFSKENIGDEIYIFSPTSKSVHIVPSSVYFRQSVSAHYSDWGQRWNIENPADPVDVHTLACAHQQMMNLMVSNLQNILLYDIHVLHSLLATCKKSTQNTQKVFHSPTNSFLALILATSSKSEIEEQVAKVLEMLRNNPAGVKISSVCINTHYFNETTNLGKAVNLLQSQNIDFCCGNFYDRSNEVDTANISGSVDKVIHNCGGLLDLSKETVKPFKIVVKKDEDLPTFLIHVHQTKHRFERMYPGKTLTPAIQIFTRSKFKIDEHSSYCDPNELKINEYYETLYTFANLHGWSKVIARRKNFGFWSFVKTGEQVDPVKLGFSVPFRSNSPQTGAEELSLTYPCIQTTEDASQSKINFFMKPHSGATFQANLRETTPLATTELQTLLKLALRRFPFVEVIARGRADFRQVKRVLVDPPTAFDSKHNLSMPVVYVEVPLEVAKGLPQEVYKVLSNNHTAIHVSNWESMPSEKLDLWKGFQYSSPPNFGVTVQNCSHEINSTVVTLKSLSFMPQVRYIVCNVAPVSPTNLNTDWMEEYFGTLFYTKRYMEHFLSIGRETGNEVEVMFRLNYICLKVNKMEYFLRFLNDINQHSAAYEIRYFIVHAFETESYAANCSNSWWRLDSYADLTNISTYVNREDEYAGREARIPFQPTPAKNSVVVYYIVVVPITLLFLFALLAQWLHHRKVKTRILTDREIRLFYNGGEQSNTIGMGCSFLDFENMKFPKHYEIPFKDIQTEEKVGSGQFGVVHRGIMSKRFEVAIKIPRSDCGKEQFKSTLSELKILCRIGEHLNIVSFLGACTKDIANGNLYIVIEYCKNGCLLKYLRENRENEDEYESISLYQMNGFSLQIASGMEYIAEKRVIHGDLAARNVLLTSEMTCKTADFGLSRRLYEMNEYVKSSQEPLPWRWMAPESLRDMQFTTMSDVWSYGVTLWEIFSLGMVPYPGLSWTVNYVSELENGMRMGKALYATDNIHAKTLDCWKLNAEERPTFTELKEYFVGLRNDQYLKLNQF